MRDAILLLRELWAERARVGLVALGVFWGTLSLGMLFAFGTSMTQASMATADAFGVDLLRVSSEATTKAYAGLPAGRGLGMVPETEAALRGMPGVRATCYEYSWGGGVTVEWQGQLRRVATAGVSAGFGDLREHRAAPGRGRFLNELDHRERRRVCFLGHRVAQRIFGAEDPVGQVLLVAGAPFRVVGVGPERVTMSNYNGEDQDKLTMPATSFRELVGWRYISHLWVGLKPGADKERIFDDLYRRLGNELSFDPSDRKALNVRDYLVTREMIESIIGGNRIFTGIVGLLGLLVSIVGVTNVMLALVEERTREFGVQLALGAPHRLLALERVLEGVLVTLSGGLLGLLLCAALLKGLAMVPLHAEVLAYLGRPQLDVGLGLSVLTLLMVFGALAGWLPARRAMRLQPAAVLREE